MAEVNFGGTVSFMRGKPPKRIVLVIMFLALAGLGGCRSPESSSVVADSIRGFSGAQGENGWSYGYWDRVSDADGNYDQMADFSLLGHFGSDPANQLSGRSEFSIGELWNLESGKYYTSLWAEGGHPHSDFAEASYTSVEHWVVRRWLSTTTGRVHIHGLAGKAMPWGKNWSGGVKVQIIVDGETVYSADIDDGGKAYSVATEVNTGSLVDFLIGPDPAMGIINFTATITSKPNR